MGRPWIGVDLDGTLAHYTKWKGVNHIGEPILEMVQRVKGWLAAKRDVRIVTARVSPLHDDVIEATIAIQSWCLEHIGKVLQVTAYKDGDMIELWDDRAVAVEKNTGRQLSPSRLMH